MYMTLNLNNAKTCPRVFVFNCQGKLYYTNNHAYDTARKALPLAIVSRTLDALRSIELKMKKR